MLKLILHTLWARRRRNGWLLAELILITVVSWAIFDPVIVSLYDRSLPLGYDASRMVLVRFAALDTEAPGYDPQAQDSAARVRTLESLMQRIRSYPDVEYATPLCNNGYPGTNWSVGQGLWMPLDSADTHWPQFNYVPGQQYFETFGFSVRRAIHTPESLSDHRCGYGEFILTEDLLKVGWGDTDPRGKTIDWMLNLDTVHVPIPAVVGPIKTRLDQKPTPVLFTSYTTNEPSALVKTGMLVAVRLREGIGMERFLHEFQSWMLQNLKAGNLYANRVQPYLSLLEDKAYATSTALFRRNLSLSVFFLVNLCLGVAGTFWVQTRTRREEVGVHLSFGATPRRIRAMLLLEGFVLVTLAVAVGCLIYWNYSMVDGLSAGVTTDRYIDFYWTDSFPVHFILVSLVVYAMLLLVTLFGVWMPARHISRIPPTEALRDE